MKRFEYTVKDPLGIHVRSAGLIAKLAKRFADTTIRISCNGKQAQASSARKLLGLKVKAGSRVTVVAEGSHEAAAIIAMSDYFCNKL